MRRARRRVAVPGRAAVRITTRRSARSKGRAPSRTAGAGAVGRASSSGTIAGSAFLAAGSRCPAVAAGGRAEAVLAVSGPAIRASPRTPTGRVPVPFRATDVRRHRPARRGAAERGGNSVAVPAGGRRAVAGAERLRLISEALRRGGSQEQGIRRRGRNESNQCEPKHGGAFQAKVSGGIVQRLASQRPVWRTTFRASMARESVRRNHAARAMPLPETTQSAA